ncbi:iron(III) transport system permease protein [Micromonospora matsumotoense]|uniref:Iron(III) transport system permease protein n=1 Tax=Micromonospora matsumotoense TaxID=121616 RepID=A0A1C4UK79_9ACTN|nr:iron ABC transporter permease [Micromonospora matsumotoense]SCE72065.1 iron(III) transport system permease protein [Micromonospora matsumotoense]
MSTIPATPSPATVPPVTTDPAPPKAGRPRRGLNANSPWFPYLLVFPLVLILFGYVVQPMFATFAESVGVDGVANYSEFVTGTGVARSALLTSLMISAASVLLCGIVGVAMAFLLKRFSFPGRRLIEAIILVPAALPPLIGAISFQLLYSETGILPRGLQHLLGTEDPVLPFTGIGGVLVVHTFTMYPFFYLAASAALTGMDPSVEEAAYNLGASRVRVWRTVLLPMLTPALVSASLLVFMTSLASYTAPLLFGVDRTMTMQIYINRTNGDLPMASTYASVLAVASVLFLLGMRWYEGRRSYRSQSKGVASHRREITNPLGKWLALTASVLATLVLLAPVATIALVAFSRDGSWTTEVIPSEYTMQNFVTIFSDPGAYRPILNSLRMSVLATVGCVVVGVLIAYAVRRLDFRGRGLLDVAVMLAWALPGTVVAINLISAFSTGNAFSFGQVLIGTFWIMPLAYFVRFLPLVFRSSSATLAQLDPSLEEAARNLGAPWWRAFGTVTLRLMLPGVLAGALLAFVNGVGEFVASVLIYTSETAPISVEINNRMYSFEVGTAAAYGMLQVVLIFIVMVFSGRLQNGGRAAREAVKWTA